ncbi:hypothetical protein HID58_094295 [Brassica napus]|uniref:Uncharacterized protein n=1 Tax=Brassica napus TaxID=3708 RepID=A0ABQ7X7U5_BRANA|nr:hypothetical protein HID58_094296 [Brassica napus]KAH0852009.1 hypothetical protein HID58_094295 [Brassica napus]
MSRIVQSSFRSALKVVRTDCTDRYRRGRPETLYLDHLESFGVCAIIGHKCTVLPMSVHPLKMDDLGLVPMGLSDLALSCGDVRMPLYNTIGHVQSIVYRKCSMGYYTVRTCLVRTLYGDSNTLVPGLRKRAAHKAKTITKVLEDRWYHCLSLTKDVPGHFLASLR